MPYTVNLLPIDAAGFIGLGPSLGGTFTTVTPAPAVATATATAAASTTLSFPTATPPPPGVVTVHVTNSTPTGDLFRSGLLTSLPPSPGTVTALSFPTSLTTLSAAALASRVAAVGRIPITPPGWVVALVSRGHGGHLHPARRRHHRNRADAQHPARHGDVHGDGVLHLPYLLLLH